MAALTVNLSPVKLGPYTKGAYIISYSTLPELPKTGLQVLLAVGSDECTIDVTGRTKGDVIGSDNLPELLDIIGGLNKWGSSVQCTIQVKSKNVLLAKSNPQSLSCPVKPYAGALNFDAIAREVPALTYPGNGHGRLWTAIDGKRYFCHLNKLETNNINRGFDCTTFPMCLFDCYLNMTGKYGTALADALGATKCDMEQKKTVEVKAFFADKGKTGLYFMWSAGHVVLVHNAWVHEFTYGGYKRNGAAGWAGYSKAPQGLWWVRKLDRLLPI